MIPLVDLAAVRAELGDELEQALTRVIDSETFIGGEEVSAFEREFAAYLGARHVVGVANGTDALELALRAIDIGGGEEVLVPAFTFIATAEAVVAAGARPRFVDVDPITGLIDMESCRRRLTRSTRAIVPVHLYGRMVEMNALTSFAMEHGLNVVEDSAQAHGARQAGTPAGTLGRVGTFSFYPGKNLGAFGDAGAIATDDDEVADRIRLLRDHGRRARDDHVLVGRNSRLDALQAAVLRVKLPRLDSWNEARRRVAATYVDSLPAEVLPRADDLGSGDVHHVFPVFLSNRDELAAHLRAKGISTRVHYRRTLPSTGAFRELADRCPAAEELAATELSLPIHPHLGDRQQAQISAAVNEFFAG